MDSSPAASRSWRDDHAREDGSYDAETWGEVDENGERVKPDAANAHRCTYDSTLFDESRLTVVQTPDGVQFNVGLPHSFMSANLSEGQAMKLAATLYLALNEPKEDA